MHHKFQMVYPAMVRGSLFPQAHYHLRPHCLRDPPSLLVNGHRGTFPTCVKWPGREAKHSTPTSAEIMNICYIYTQHVFTVYTRLTLPTLEPNLGHRGDKLAANRPHYSTVER